MNADVMVRARKVFLQHKIVEYSEICPHCRSKGLENKLRYFYISLDEAIYKCENATCLYPFDHFVFKSLIDNSEYQYEEVLDGGREAFLRVPLDGQPSYEAQNPISTKLFCESQRNPDIENYNLDFSDLFNDIDTLPKPNAQPETTDNLDFLDLLDEVQPAAQDLNASEILDENGIDKFIINMLEAPSPVKQASEPTPTMPETQPNAPKAEPTLSKCLQHIKKTKSAKVKQESSFAAKIQKARKSQSQPQSCASSLKAKAEHGKKLPISPPKKASAMGKLLNSTGFLRPTELAQKLGSMKMTTVDSAFLRQCMQEKQATLFADEQSGTEDNDSKCETSEAAPSVKLSTKVNSASAEHMRQYIQTDKSHDAIFTQRKVSTPVEQGEKSNDTPTETSVKKVRKSGVKKPKATNVNTDQSTKSHISTDLPVVKQEPNTKPETSKPKSTQKKKKSEPQMTDTPKANLNEGARIKREKAKNNRKRKSSTTEIECSIQSKPESNAVKEDLGPVVKKQCKPKQENKAKSDGEKDKKPSRRQSSKSKDNSNTTVVASTATAAESNPSNPSYMNSADEIELVSESSSEILLGFLDPKETTQTEPTPTVPYSSKPVAVVTSRRSIRKKPNEVKLNDANRKEIKEVKGGNSSDKTKSQADKRTASKDSRDTPQMVQLGSELPNIKREPSTSKEVILKGTMKTAGERSKSRSKEHSSGDRRSSKQSRKPDSDSQVRKVNSDDKSNSRKPASRKSKNTNPTNRSKKDDCEVIEVIIEKASTSTKSTRKNTAEKKPEDAIRALKSQSDSGHHSSSKRSETETKVTKSRTESESSSQNDARPSNQSKTDSSVVINVIIDSSDIKQEPSTSNGTKMVPTEENVIDKGSQTATQSSDDVPENQPEDVDNDTCAKISVVIDESNEIEIIEDDSESNCESLKLLKSEPNHPRQYYVRKSFNKAKDQQFKLDNILGDWSESENEQSEKPTRTNSTDSCLKPGGSQENDDIISITSDSSVAPGNEPHSEDE